MATKQTLEFEVLDSGREKSGVQHPQSDPGEFWYRAFRDAYNKTETDYDGNMSGLAFTDNELRVIWRKHYRAGKTFTHRQLELLAKRVQESRWGNHQPVHNAQMVFIVALIIAWVFVLLQ